MRLPVEVSGGGALLLIPYRYITVTYPQRNGILDVHCTYQMIIIQNGHFEWKHFNFVQITLHSHFVIKSFFLQVYGWFFGFLFRAYRCFHTLQNVKNGMNHFFLSELPTRKMDMWIFIMISKMDVWFSNEFIRLMDLISIMQYIRDMFILFIGFVVITECKLE